MSTEPVSGVPSDELFRNPELQWRGVSPKLALEWRVPAIVVAAFALVPIVFGIGWADSTASIVLVAIGAAMLVGVAVTWVVVGRVARSWRYAEREQDLLVSHGRMFRRLTVIPYGRMQVIEVTANPVSGWLGIATVVLVTASASTDARIPGLPVDEAHLLRDRLAAKGEALTAGL